MSRSKEIRRFEAALKGKVLSELEWAVEFSKHMLKHMKLKQSVDFWRKRKELAQARYAEVKGRLTSA